jgi:hypothetical protein
MLETIVFIYTHTFVFHFTIVHGHVCNLNMHNYTCQGTWMHSFGLKYSD